MNGEAQILLAGFVAGFLLSGVAVLTGCVAGFTAFIWSRRVRHALNAKPGASCEAELPSSY
jgi:hypothetical protein